MDIVIKVIIICGIMFTASAQGPNRNRGEGFYQTVNSNTPGAGNSWITPEASFFIWANKSPDTTNAVSSTKPGYFPFAALSSETGILNNASLIMESRLLSYSRNNRLQFGNIAAGGKLTLPDNRQIRFHGLGLELKYIWNYPGDTFPSLAGYRLGATGFAPEGYIVSGSNFQFKAIYDADFIGLYSWLPIKIAVNAGMRIPLKKAGYAVSQYLFSTAISYNGLQYDAFAEYYIEAFNNLTGPIKFVNPEHTIEVHFAENPMYISLGGRIRYNNGVTLYACIPFLVSANVGSAMTTEDLVLLNRSTGKGSVYYDEKSRGITDPFDPWFAKWKIIARISFPLFYKQTGSEMMRNFLLLKNKKDGKKIDIDDQLKTFDKKKNLQSDEEKERKKRLDEIQKRREQIDKTDQ